MLPDIGLALAEDLRPPGSMDRPVNTAPAGEAWMSGIDDGIGVLIDQVTANDAHDRRSDPPFERQCCLIPLFPTEHPSSTSAQLASVCAFQDILVHMDRRIAHRLVIVSVLIACSVLASVCTVAAAPVPFNAEMHGDTTVILRFLATDVSAEIDGTAVLDATFGVEESPVHLSVQGEVGGEGSGDSYTLAAEGWVVFDLTGTSDPEAGSTRLRGVLQLSASGISTENPSGQATGSFVAVLEVSGGIWKLLGDVTATAAGSVVPPEIQYTMQVEAAYALILHGDAMPLYGVPDNGEAQSLLLDPWPGAGEAQAAFGNLFDASPDSDASL